MLWGTVTNWPFTVKAFDKEGGLIFVWAFVVRVPAPVPGGGITSEEPGYTNAYTNPEEPAFGGPSDVYPGETDYPIGSEWPDVGPAFPTQCKHIM